MIGPKSRQRGAGLLEPLVAIVILSFGILGLARFQVKMVSQATDAQARLAATALSEDLLTQLRVDLSNAACYTLPQAGTCSSAFAKTAAADWKARVQSVLPGYQDAKATITNTNTFTVTLSWASKSFKKADGTAELRSLEVSTDVRP
jgi:type IV pilus assembly protein PilV